MKYTLHKAWLGTMILAWSAILIAAGAIMVNRAHAQTASGLLMAQLQFGSRGAEVSKLQTFLATNSLVYPEQLVTGYFGALTQKAVIQFQIAYGIPAVGRVGPMTLQKMNMIMSTGSGIDVSVPAVTSTGVTSTSGQNTVTWQTNEPANGKLYYSTAPLIVAEASAPQFEPAVSGSLYSDASFSLSKSTLLPSLSAGATYYYTIVARDQSGNVGMIWPRSFIAQ